MHIYHLLETALDAHWPQTESHPVDIHRRDLWFSGPVGYLPSGYCALYPCYGLKSDKLAKLDILSNYRCFFILICPMKVWWMFWFWSLNTSPQCIGQFALAKSCTLLYFCLVKIIFQCFYKMREDKGCCLFNRDYSLIYMGILVDSTLIRIE